MLPNLALSVYHSKRTSDWEGRREVGRKACGQEKKDNLAMIEEVCV